MKKIILSLTTIFSLSVGAQTLTQATHAPAVGETFTRFQCDSTGISLGTSGASQVWNYSSLLTHTTIASDYAARTNTNTAYNPADVVMNYMPNDNNSYFKSSSTDLKYYGGNFLMGSFAVVLNFSTPTIVAKYPMSLNTANSNTVAGTMSINGSITGTFEGNAGFVADGTGTLVLPAKTFTDVIKVSSSQIVDATLSLGTATLTQMMVDYYSISNPKAALLTISTNTVVSIAGTNTQTLVTILKDYTTVGVYENEKTAIELNVFPNPSSAFVNFNTTSKDAYKTMAYDVTGKLVATEVFENNQCKLNTERLANGVYLYTVVSKNNQVLSSGKFNIEK